CTAFPGGVDRKCADHTNHPNRLDEAGMSLLRKYWMSEFGGGAAEFAIVLIPFAALIFAIIHLCLLFYANQTLHFATEGAARCASVLSSTTCNNLTNIRSYASGLYKGPNISVAFDYSTTGANNCGHTVTGSGTYQLNAVFVRVGVPLAASACFP